VLYPFFEETGDYKALSREFRLRESDTEFITYFMTVTDTHVYTWKQAASGWEVVPKQTFAHGFKKNPTIYSYRRNTLCENIRQIRNRLETILSNYADCIDYNFAPKLVAVGEILNNNPKASRGGLVQVENGGDLKYLSWQQSPEAAKLEIDTLLEQAYSLTNTPRISFENLKGTGSALSGVAFKFAFMGIHTAVQNHAETIGEHLQRRYNFLASAVGSINTAFEKASETIDLDVEIVPYTLDNLKDNVGIAVEAVSGGVASKRTGIVLAGLIDAEKADEELKAIEADEQDKRIAVHTEE
jgi:SPP1 family phage portal protein